MREEETQRDERTKDKQAKSLTEDRLLSPSSSGQKLRVVKRCPHYHLEKSTSWLKTASRTVFVKLDGVGGQEEISVEEKLLEISEGI